MCRYFQFFIFFILTSFITNVGASQAKLVVTQMLGAADVQIDGERPWDITVHNNAFYKRILNDQSLGFGESYMEGWWDSIALDACIFHILRADLEKNLTPTWLMRWEVFKAKLFNRQSRSRSMQVIDQHYQLGNDFFEKMLDPLMTYSCGYWDKAATLEEAQKAKYDLIARKLGLESGMRVLDIGCGWGGFARYISEHYGVQVVAITLSENQAAYAKMLCQGFPVEVRVQDYRDVHEVFDRIVEIGMFEHVGQKNYRTFMEITHRCLKENGMLMLHTIGRNTSALTCDPWIDKYIFPGGHLPSITQIGASIEGLFIMEDWHNFSVDYDKTLMAWFDNFNTNWEQMKESYSPTFYRMWKFYLLSCAGAFRARQIQLWQVVLSKDGVLGGYTSVR
jgi:cyclopropane-fatty-acyl-phospholipid synthase